MRGPLAWARLSFALHRWEVLASVAGVGVVAAAMVWFAWQLRMLAGGEASCPDPAAFVPGCEQFAQRFMQTSEWGTRLLYLSWAAPFGMGLVLGVPLVAREVEHRTAGMAWTLSRSRAWWLARRVVFLALVLAALLGVLAVVSEILAAALLPLQELDRDFTWYGRRGGLIVVRGLAALGIGVTLGAVVGRQLPGVLGAAFASVLVFTAVSLGMDRWNQTDAMAHAYDMECCGVDSERAGALFVGQRTELVTGELVTYEELQRRGLTYDAIDGDGGLYASLDDVGQRDKLIGWDRELLVPGSLYPRVVLRESAVLGALALLLGLAATFVVGRRRPG
ncbi:MAG: hypothetical protein ACRDHD_06900 [Candidatus Limnocylindria bacterium]